MGEGGWERESGRECGREGKGGREGGWERVGERDREGKKVVLHCFFMQQNAHISQCC